MAVRLWKFHDDPGQSPVAFDLLPDCVAGREVMFGSPRYILRALTSRFQATLKPQRDAPGHGEMPGVSASVAILQTVERPALRVAETSR